MMIQFVADAGGLWNSYSERVFLTQEVPDVVKGLAALETPISVLPQLW